MAARKTKASTKTRLDSAAEALKAHLDVLHAAQMDVARLREDLQAAEYRLRDAEVQRSELTMGVLRAAVGSPP